MTYAVSIRVRLIYMDEIKNQKDLQELIQRIGLP